MAGHLLLISAVGILLLSKETEIIRVEQLAAVGSPDNPQDQLLRSLPRRPALLRLHKMDGDGGRGGVARRGRRWGGTRGSGQSKVAAALPKEAQGQQQSQVLGSPGTEVSQNKWLCQCSCSTDVRTSFFSTCYLL